MNRTNQKIRVCFVSPKAYPIFNPDIESVFGGAEVDTYMIATELAKDDAFDVSFIVADYGQPDEEVRENVRILKSLHFKQNSLVGAWKIWKALKRADADVYMMKTASPGVPLVQYFCQKYHRRFIYKTANQGECCGTYFKQHPILGKLFIRSLQKAANVITQNQQDGDNLKHQFNINSIVIPNGHRISETVPAKKDVILWVGRSAEVKNPRRFLDLAMSFSKERFVMICQQATGDMGYSALKSEAENIENLIFIEHVPFHKIDGYFEQAKVLVNTSDSEGFPNIFIQACKASAAILSYTVNPDDFLNKHQCGVCCHGDMTAMLNQLGEMLCEKCYQRFGNNGLKYVKDQHDIKTIIDHYKSVFHGNARSAT